MNETGINQAKLIQSTKDHIKEWLHGDGLRNTIEDLDKFFKGTSWGGHRIAYDNALPMIREFLISQFPNVKRVLIDPEATNKRAIHAYQKVGFKIIGEFIASWHPVLHYQMELYMDDLLKANVSHNADA